MSESTRPEAEPNQADKFAAAMRKILAVPKKEILRREAEHMKRQREKRLQKD